MFARLFEFDDIGQVLVTRGETDDGYEVRFHHEPKDFVVCSIALNFPDTDDGYESAIKCLDNITERHARGAAQTILKPLYPDSGPPPVDELLKTVRKEGA